MPPIHRAKFRISDFGFRIFGPSTRTNFGFRREACTETVERRMIWYPASGIRYPESGRLGNELREVVGGWADDLQSRARGRVGEGEGDGVE